MSKTFEDCMVLLRMVVKDLKETICMIEYDCSTGYFTMRYRLLDHRCEELGKFGKILFPDASVYGNLSVVLTMKYG